MNNFSTHILLLLFILLPSLTRGDHDDPVLTFPPPPGGLASTMACSASEVPSLTKASALALQEKFDALSVALKMIASQTAEVEKAGFPGRSPVRLGDLAAMDFPGVGSTLHDTRAGRVVEVMVPGWGDRALDEQCQWDVFKAEGNRITTTVSIQTVLGNCIEIMPRNLTVLCAQAPYNLTCPTVEDAVANPRLLPEWDMATHGYCPQYCLDPARYDFDLNQYDMDFAYSMTHAMSELGREFPDIDAYIYVTKRNFAYLWPSLERFGTTLAESIDAAFNGTGIPTPLVMQPVYFLSTPPANPNRTMRWTPPFFGVAQVEGLSAPTYVTALAPVYVYDEMKGALHAEVPLESIKDVLDAGSVAAGSVSLIVDSPDGSIISASESTLDLMFCPGTQVCDEGGTYNSQFHQNFFQGQPLRVTQAANATGMETLVSRWQDASAGSQTVGLQGVLYEAFWQWLGVRGSQWLLLDLVPQEKLEHAVEWSFTAQGESVYRGSDLVAWWSEATTKNATGEQFSFEIVANLTNTGELRVPFYFDVVETHFPGSSARALARADPELGWLEPRGGTVTVRLMYTVQALDVDHAPDCTPTIAGAACGSAPELPSVVVFKVESEAALENGRCFSPLVTSVVLNDLDKASAVHSSAGVSMRTLGIAAASTLGGLLVIMLVCCGVFRVRHAVERERKAKEQLRNEEDFVSFVFHEMRTPLNGAHAYLNFARQGFENDGDPQTIAKDVRSASRCMDHSISVLDRMLDLARLASGEMQLVEKPMQVASIAATVIDMQVHSGNQHVELRSSVDPDIEVVLGDRQRLTQVLLNLVNNAAKYTEEGFVELRVKRLGVLSQEAVDEQMGRRPRLSSVSRRTSSRVRPAPTSESSSSVAELVQYVHLQFEVLDSGIGVPEHLQKTLFKKYARAVSAESIRGTGLGLLISQRLVDAMKGRIKVESPWTPKHSGSRFYFDVNLPIATMHGAARSTMDSMAPIEERDGSDVVIDAEPEPAVPDGVRVLLVDDVPLNLKILKRRFTSSKSVFAPFGWHIETAVHGEEMLERLRDESLLPIDLIVCDEIMVKTGGVLTGSEACRELRKWEAETGRPPLVFISCSGLVSESDRAVMLKHGVDHCWGKPVPSGDAMLADISHIWQDRHDVEL